MARRRGTNVTLDASHEAIQFIFGDVLKDKQYPVKDTHFVVKHVGYAGARDDVSLHGNVDDQSSGVSFDVTLTWRGAQLKLDQIDAKSSRTCARLDLACKTKLAIENVSAATFAALLKSTKYYEKPMIPSTGSEDVRFSVGGRKYRAALWGKGANSQANTLLVFGNLYIGGDQ
jgi:hypothetical protein